MGNGDPPDPIFQDSQLDGFVFMVPAISSDFQFGKDHLIDNQPLQLLWVLPITSAERQLINEHGMADFCDLLQQNRHQPVIDAHRNCYASQSAVANEYVG